jgi:hypothetical protein
LLETLISHAKQSAWRFLKNVLYQWIEDSPFQLAAALSYYALFSMAPLLVISISVAGFFFGSEAAQNRIVDTIRETVGQESAQAIQAMIQNAERCDFGLWRRWLPDHRLTLGLLFIAHLFFRGGVYTGLRDSVRIGSRAGGKRPKYCWRDCGKAIPATGEKKRSGSLKLRHHLEGAFRAAVDRAAV